MEDEAVNLGSVEVTSAVAHEEEKTIRKRKSLAVDETTYEMLSRICAERRRSKI